MHEGGLHGDGSLSPQPRVREYDTYQMTSAMQDAHYADGKH